jgi:hypothetical protein
MQEKNEENILLVLITIILLGAVMIYLNENVSLLEFRVLFFFFFVPVFVEFLLFRKRFHSTLLRKTLFFHTSSFVVLTIGLYIRENEQLFFGLFFAGFLIIILSYILLESFSTTSFIMKIFTASIAFWIVYSYFPLGRALSVVFGAVAFFLSYIFFEIPGATEPVKEAEPEPDKPVPVEEPLQSLKSTFTPDSTPTKAEKIFVQREFAQVTNTLDQLITRIRDARYPEYSHLKDQYDYVRSLYEKRKDSFERSILPEDLKKVHTTMNQCSTLLSNMSTAQTEWNTLRNELIHLGDHTREVSLDQVTTLTSQFLAFREQVPTLIPELEIAAFKKELGAVADAVARYDRIKKEWTQLVRDVNTLMGRIQVATRDECSQVKTRFNTNWKAFQRCILPEKIAEVYQKIVYCESQITLIHDWNTLTEKVDALVKGIETGSVEKVLKLEREFLSRIDEFESVVSPREISWMKVTFKLCYSRVNEQSHTGDKVSS